MKELRRMNWTKWMTWMNSNEWLDIHELNGMNWNEWIKMNDLSTSSWKNEKKKRGGFWRFLCHQVLDDDVVDKWHEALATVARTLCRPHCRPHLQKVVATRQFFYLCEIELSLQSCARFVDLIFKKWKNCQCLTILMPSTTWRRCGRQMKWRSRCSLAHTLLTSWSTSSSKNAKIESSAFYDFYVKSCSCYSLMHILSTSSSKRKKNFSFLRSLCDIELSPQSRAHFVDHFPDRGAQPRKQTPSSGNHGQPLCPKKNTGFCARECFQPWIQAFPIAHTSQLLDDDDDDGDDDDDVIDMMMWLTWWCGWHDDVVDMMVRQLAVRIVRNSEVSWLNFLW